jgi:SAM-dependent methyltransferase
VTNLPYRDGMFDRIFCISVLEHLDDFFNRHAGWRVPGLLRFAFHRAIEQSLREFRRVLTDDGVIVLTFDHPDINLDYLFEVTGDTGLEPAGEVRRDIPPDALFCEPLGLRCFRLVLKKKGPAPPAGH